MKTVPSQARLAGRQRLVRLVLVALALLLISQAARGENLPALTFLPGVTPLFSEVGEVPPAASDVPVDGYLDLQHMQNLNALRAAAQQCQSHVAANTGKAPGALPSAAQAVWVLGLLHLHGKGGAVDRRSAADAFRLAWQCGYPLASAGLAWCAIDGCSGDMSVQSVQTWTDVLLRVRPGRALYLRWMLFQRLSPLAVKSATTHSVHAQGFLAQAQPQQWLQQAAALNDAQAVNELGIAAYEAGKLPEAIAYFASVAAASDAARFNLGVAQARQQWSTLSQSGSAVNIAGAGTNQDDGSSRQVSDLLRLALRQHRGEGIPVNFQEAIRYYRLAAEAGSMEARRMLTLIYARLLPDGRIDVEWMTQLARLPLFAGSKETQRFLKREPSPLYDLLPLFWRR